MEVSKGISTLSNLVAMGATIVNREVGSGSRLLLEQTDEICSLSVGLYLLED